MNFIEKLEERQKKANSLLCVGLDSDISQIPRSVIKTSKGTFHTIYNFNQKIISETLPFVCAYKINIAFYEAQWIEGFYALINTINFIREKAPDVPIILDAKRADIGNTNEQYAKMVFDVLKADAITVNPYFGRESLDPFLKRTDKGIIILCHTSNPGAKEFQGLKVVDAGSLRNLYEQVARNVALSWNKNNNCLLVVGATHPNELKTVRRIVGEGMPILVPGIGTQKGNLEETLKAGLNEDGQGLIINSSRDIIFASDEKDFAKIAGKKAKDLREQINKTRTSMKR
ncbi:MAG: orotidine-5'-phosphate decarboxylase [Candidatus Nealsonbacteria bacterium]|nr:orotidine-5'-phosphate decarboxylase [Candidatus Nealsonbacteria bacterium]